MGWFSKDTPHREVHDRIKRFERKIEVADKLDEVDVDIHSVGSDEFQRIQAPYIEGVMHRRDISLTGGSITIMNKWERAARIARHLHAEENEHIFILSGQMRVHIFGKTNERFDLSEPNPYVRIPKGTPHTAVAVTDCEFVTTFEPWQEA